MVEVVKMKMKDKIKNMIFNFFFIYEDKMTEEELERERKNDNLLSMVFGILSIIGSMLIFLRFFVGEFNIFTLLDLLLLLSIIASGLFALLLDWQNKLH
jgi:hypothetical protein